MMVTDNRANPSDAEVVWLELDPQMQRLVERNADKG